MIILDSNIWIAWFDKDDSQHAKARELLGKVDESIVVPEYVAAEVCTILSKKAGKSAARLFSQTLFDNMQADVLFSTPAFFIATLQEFLSNEDQRLSFVDTSLLVFSQQYRITTFDRALARAIEKTQKK